MLAFQVHAQKKEEEEAADARQGRKKFREQPDILSEQVIASVPAIEKVFREKGVSEFLSTLTPGAQNAIYAASFAWGFENAAKYVKSAMKLDEVKNAADTESRSQAVVESIQSQSHSDSHETSKESSSFVWGFYNEDLKETQAYKGKSEHLLDRHSHEREQQLQLPVPVAAPEAVANGIALQTHTPALLYCANAQQAIHAAMEQQAAEQKKEQLARLVESKQHGQAEERGEKAREAQLREMQKDAGHVRAAGAEGRAIASDSQKLALERKEELEAEYKKTGEKLQEAIRVLDEMAEWEKGKVRMIASALPSEIGRLLLSHERRFSKRRALRAQLSKWLAFCEEGRSMFSLLPASRLLKMVSLSSLLRFGR